MVLKTLEGKIKISGSKNSSLPILASSLLIDEEIDLQMFQIFRCFFMIKILESLDSKVNFKNSVCQIKSNQPKS